jgi:hypothetical protein
MLAAMYYASAVLWAMEPYFLLDEEIIAEPKQHPDVLFRFATLPAKSESA